MSLTSLLGRGYTNSLFSKTRITFGSICLLPSTNIWSVMSQQIRKLTCQPHLVNSLSLFLSLSSLFSFSPLPETSLFLLTTLSSLMVNLCKNQQRRYSLVRISNSESSCIFMSHSRGFGGWGKTSHMCQR